MKKLIIVSFLAVVLMAVTTRAVSAQSCGFAPNTWWQSAVTDSLLASVGWSTQYHYVDYGTGTTFNILKSSAGGTSVEIVGRNNGIELHTLIIYNEGEDKASTHVWEENVNAFPHPIESRAWKDGHALYSKILQHLEGLPTDVRNDVVSLGKKIPKQG